MSSLINILEKITHPSQLGSSIFLLQNIPATKLTVQILLLLRNVLQINSEDLQQYNGLVIVYKIIRDALTQKYDDSEWLTIHELFSDIIVGIFESVVNYRKSYFLKEKKFCNLIKHAVQFLMPLIKEIDSVRITFTKNGFATIVGVACLEEFDFTIRKDLLLLFKQVLAKADLRLRKIIINNDEVTVIKIAQLSLFCGDFETQECIIEILLRFSLTSKQKLKKIIHWYKNHPQVTRLIDVLDYSNFDTSCREFLNGLNDSINSDMKVISLPCLEAFANDILLEKPKNEKYKELWADFSMSTGSIHIVCDGGGNTWMKLYVEFRNVKTVFCSNRDMKDFQAVKQVLVELTTPLKVQLHSFELYIVTLTLRFLEEPKFYTLEECFFQKCYKNVYKVEKQIRSLNSSNNSFTFSNCGKGAVHGRKCFCDCASSISSIKTTPSSCTKKCHKTAVNLLETGGPASQKNSNSRHPFTASTPKPVNKNLPSPNNIMHNFQKEERGNLKINSNFSNKKIEVEKKNDSFSKRKSSTVNHLRDSSFQADSEFKVMCEEKLSEIRSQSQIQRLSQGMPQGKSPEAPKEESTTIKEVNSIPNHNSATSEINKNTTIRPSEDKVKEGDKKNHVEEHSEDSPFHLTSVRQKDFVKTALCGETDNMKIASEKNKSNNIQEHKTSTESNLKKLKNLLVSRDFNEKGLCQKSLDQRTSSGLSITCNNKKTEHAKLDSSKSSPEIFGKSSDSRVNKQKDSFSGDKHSTKLILAPSRFTKFSQFDHENSSSQKSMNFTTNDQTNGKSIENTCDPLSEPKTKKANILRSPKLFSKENKSISIKSVEHENKVNDIRENVLELFKKTKSKKPLKEGTMEPGFIEKSESIHNPLYKEKDLMKNVDPPTKPYSVSQEGNESSCGEIKNLNEVKNISGDCLSNNNFGNSNNSCFPKNMTDQGLEKTVQKSYVKKSIRKRSSINAKKHNSPESSFHLRIPIRTYNSKISSKATIKQSTPEKMFENLKNQKSKGDAYVKLDGTTVSKKRKLFNPNESLEDISSIASEKQAPEILEAPQTLPSYRATQIKKSEESGKINSMSKQKEPLLFQDVYEFFPENNKIAAIQKVSKRPRRSVYQRSKPNYIEISSNDSFSGEIGSRKNNNFSGKVGLTRDEEKEKDLNRKCSKDPSPEFITRKEYETLILEKKDHSDSNKEIKEKIVRDKSNTTKGKKKPTKKGLVLLEISSSSSSVDSECAQPKCSSRLRKKAKLTKETECLREISNQKTDLGTTRKHNGMTAENIKLSLSTKDSGETYSQVGDKKSVNEEQRTLSYFSKKTCTNRLPKQSTIDKPEMKERKTTKNEKEKIEFTSLVERPEVFDALRDGEESEMRIEEEPVDERKSDVSSLQLDEPPFRFSSEGSVEVPQETGRQTEISSKLNSTGTQAEARAELDFLDAIMTRVENMSLTAGRKKILTGTGSLESSLKKLEMFSEAYNNQINNKYTKLKKNLELMRSNLDNIIASSEEYIQSYQTKMTDIKSTMTRLSKDVEIDQDVKVKIIEDIEKMCRERKNIVKIDNFF